MKGIAPCPTARVRQWPEPGPSAPYPFGPATVRNGWHRSIAASSTIRRSPPVYFGAWRREGQEFPRLLAFSGGADGVRASEAEHAVERLDGDLGFDLLG